VKLERAVRRATIADRAEAATTLRDTHRRNRVRIKVELMTVRVDQVPEHRLDTTRRAGDDGTHAFNP
jgi:hypothetical protein